MFQLLLLLPLFYQKCRCSNFCYCYLCFTKSADVPTFAIATFVLPKVPMFQSLLLLTLFYQKCRCSNVCCCYFCYHGSLISILCLTFAVRLTRLPLFFVAMIKRMFQKCFYLFKMSLNRNCGIVHLMNS